MSTLPKNYEEKSREIGGQFRLTSLIVKRSRELIGKRRGIFAGADTKDGHIIQMAFLELEQGRIRLKLNESIEDDGEIKGTKIKGARAKPK